MTEIIKTSKMLLVDQLQERFIGFFPFHSFFMKLLAEREKVHLGISFHSLCKSVH